jgi:hypothetical protein
LLVGALSGNCRHTARRLAHERCQRISKTGLKIIFKIIAAIIALWLIVYGSSFIAGMTAALLGVALHWNATAVVWCVRVVQFIVVFGFLYVLYLAMRQKKPTIK